AENGRGRGGQRNSGTGQGCQDSDLQFVGSRVTACGSRRRRSLRLRCKTLSTGKDRRGHSSRDPGDEPLVTAGFHTESDLMREAFQLFKSREGARGNGRVSAVHALV